MYNTLTNTNTHILYYTIHVYYTRALSAMNITLVLNTGILEIKQHSIILAPVNKNKVTEIEKTYELYTNLTILTTGMEPTALLNNICDLKKDRFGRLIVTPTLQCINHPNIFALGDCSTIQKYRSSDSNIIDTLPKTAQVAMQQSDTLAKNIYRRTQLYPKTIDNTTIHAKIHYTISPPGELESFRFLPLGEMLSLGTTDAAITSLGMYIIYYLHIP